MATITESNLKYFGSISIDESLCKDADLLPFEKVEIYNCNNGNRFSTYVILGKKGEICVNGAAARQVQKGDIIIIASYSEYSNLDLQSYKPKLIFVDDSNNIRNHKNYIDSTINE